MFYRGLKAIYETVANGGKVLLVGTKRQAGDIIAQTAVDAGHYYINERWLGGLLTNWNTIQVSIKQLKELEVKLGESRHGFTKKELLNLERQKDKLERSLGGIKNMGGLPDIIFIIDVLKEELAIKEANRLGIPVVAVVDTNGSVNGITYPIPGNDDATRAIQAYCTLVGQTITSAMSNRREAPVEQSAANDGRGRKSARNVGKKSADAESAPEAAPETTSNGEDAA